MSQSGLLISILRDRLDFKSCSKRKSFTFNELRFDLLVLIISVTLVKKWLELFYFVA